MVGEPRDRAPRPPSSGARLTGDGDELRYRPLRQDDAKLLTLVFTFTGTESTGLHSNVFEREGMAAPKLCSCIASGGYGEAKLCRCPIKLEGAEHAAERGYGLAEGVVTHAAKDLAYARAVLARLPADAYDVLRRSFGPLTREDPFDGARDEDTGKGVARRPKSQAVEEAVSTSERSKFFARDLAGIVVLAPAARLRAAGLLRREWLEDPVTTARRQSELDLLRGRAEAAGASPMAVAMTVLAADEAMLEAHIAEASERKALAAINEVRSKRAEKNAGNREIEWLRHVRDQAKRLLERAGDAWRTARDAENAARKAAESEAA